MSMASESKDERRQHRWSMLFTNSQVEDAFLRGRREKMFRNLSRCCAIVIVLNLIGLVQLVLTMFVIPEVIPPPTNLDEAHDLILFYVGFLVLYGLFASAMRLPCVTRHLEFRCSEVLAVLLVLSLFGAELLFRSIGNRHLSEELRLFKTTSTALTFDAIVTVSNLLLPTRWIMTVWTNVICIVSYTVFHQLQNSATYRGDIGGILVLSGLVFGASLGLRANESNERAMFAVIVDERTLRAQAERSAEVGQGGILRTKAPAPSVGQASSAPSTTDTGQLFQQVRVHVATPWAGRNLLEDLEALGRKEQWLIEREDLVRKPIVLGEGGQASVFLGTLSFGFVAIKVPKKQQAAYNPAMWDEPPTPSYSPTMWDELRILRHVRHPHIALFHGACIQSEGTVLLVMEVVRGKCLDTFLSHWHERWQFLKHQAARQAIMQDVCEALAYLHSLKPCVVHGDLKPNNMHVELRERGPFAKLLDFGLARTVTRHEARVTGGTRHYMAPELRAPSSRVRRADPAVDVFSLGKLLHLSATGDLPAVVAGRRSLWSSSPTLRQDWAAIITASLQERPEMRPPIREVQKQLFSEELFFPWLLSEDAEGESCEQPAGQPVVRKLCL